MIRGTGKLLTAEQSVRLALMQSVDRQRLIEAIAAGLRHENHPGTLGGDAPYSFYSRPVLTSEWRALIK